MPILTSPAEFWSMCPKGRVAGLDVGEKTVGIALSDTLRMIANPYQTLVRTQWKKNGPSLCALFQEHHIKGLVIGWPLHMDGGEGARCHATRHFTQNLLALQDLPIIFWDERMSTIAATRILRDEADLSRQKRKPLIDAVAASLVLDSFLATQRRILE